MLYTGYTDMKTPRQKPHGFSLIELMVAMTIGLIIMAGVGTVFFKSKQTYNVQSEFSRLQESGRFALDFMARFVRGAGFAGCASGLSQMTNTLNDKEDMQWNFSTGVEGYEAANTGPGEILTLSNDPQPATSNTAWTTSDGSNPPAAMADGSSDAILPGSDILVARSADDLGVEVADNNQGAQLFATHTGTETNACPDGSNRYSGFCEGDVLMVSDCQKSVAFQITNINVSGGTVNIKHDSSLSDPGNAITSWGGNSGTYSDLDFGEGSEMMKVSTKVFYVGKGVNGPALFLKQGDNDGLEIIEGVESMQILYGEDTSQDNIPNRFVTADNVSDFGNVVAIKISLLLASTEEISHWPVRSDTYLLTGHSAATSVTVNPVDDKRMRRVMSVIVKLRNRGFTL